MGFQQARLNLCELFQSNLDSDWTVTTETVPDKFHKLVEVGHASPIMPMTMASYQGDVTVTFWVCEDVSMTAADELYALFDPTPGCVFDFLKGSSGNDTLLSSVASNIGRRDEGPSGFLAGDVIVTVQVFRS